MATSSQLSFTVKPRILTLLGDQLIRDATVAVFELVKNAYDADATTCEVTLEHPTNEKRGTIRIRDNGSGMDETVLKNAWMVIGTDFRALQKGALVRSPKFSRLPLGEKGLGRLSVHKLGRSIRMVTRKAGGRELVLSFDWEAIESAENLDTAFVQLRQQAPVEFPGKQHGTLVEVTRLREHWTRGEARRLYRSVNALRSPYEEPSDFSVSLNLPDASEWLDDLFSSEDARGAATYFIEGILKGKSAQFTYRFQPPPGYEKQLTASSHEVSNVPLLKRVGRKSEPIDLTDFKIGEVRFQFLVFDRDPKVLRAVTDDLAGLKKYLDENGGIRVYREGIRVYDFGEPGNDWLNLDLRRVNTPTARVSNNQILGVLQLNGETSQDLREKTNREGFIETPAYAAFRDAVISVLTWAEAEKTRDQRRLRETLGKGTGEKVFQRLAELRAILIERGELDAIEPTLRAVEQELETYRDQLLHAAVPGLTIGIMLHGAEKILDELRATVREEFEPKRVRELIDRLYRAMRPVSNLLKNPGLASISASTIVKEALFSAEYRLKRHDIHLLATDLVREDFIVKGSRQMLIAAVTNLVDNSIHWLDVRNPKRRLLYIGVTRELDGGPAIIVADNGPGFGKDLPEDLITPFFTRRHGGMGLGLYIVNEVMRVTGGQVVFPQPGDLALPHGLTGAVVALQFSTDDRTAQTAADRSS